MHLVCQCQRKSLLNARLKFGKAGIYDQRYAEEARKTATVSDFRGFLIFTLKIEACLCLDKFLHGVKRKYYRKSVLRIG